MIVHGANNSLAYVIRKGNVRRVLQRPSGTLDLYKLWRSRGLVNRRIRETGEERNTSKQGVDK